MRHIEGRELRSGARSIGRFRGAEALRSGIRGASAALIVATRTIALSAGASISVDPRSVAALADNTQYSVVVEGTGVTVAAIVAELNFQGGDGAMTYEGFPR